MLPDNDDYGADNDGAPGQPPFRDNLAPARGDYRYPADAARYGYHAADLRELRNGAYWVDAMVVRDTKAQTVFGEVEATTFAFGGTRGRAVTDPPSTYTSGGLTPATVQGRRSRRAIRSRRPTGSRRS